MSPDGTGRGSKARQRHIGLALAGGGPEGAVYEIGALRALDEALEGVELNDLYIYVGVSAGAFIAACLANNITTAQMCRAVVKSQPGEHPFEPRIFLTPAVGEWVRRGLSVPGLLADAIWDYVRHPWDLTLVESLTRISRALPVGIFDNEPIRAYLEHIYHLKERTDDFRRLGKHLVVVAADLDSGQPIRFGEPPMDHVPISRAVQASTALPGLYPPVAIDGRNYVDGVLLKTLHASVALEAQASLVFCINPIVPVDTARAVEAGFMRTGQLLNRGLPTVLSQTFRTMIHSRLEAGMSRYDGLFPGADVVLLEPRRDDYRMFFTNIFRFSDRRAVCNHGYQRTRQELWDRRQELAPILARHGVRLRTETLGELEREVWDGVGRRREGKPADTLTRLDRALTRIERLMEEESAGDEKVSAETLSSR